MTASPSDDKRQPDTTSSSRTSRPSCCSRPIAFGSSLCTRPTLIFLNVQQCCAVNSESEPFTDSLDEPRKVIDFGSTTPESASSDDLGADHAEMLRRQPGSK